MKKLGTVVPVVAVVCGGLLVVALARSTSETQSSPTAAAAAPTPALSLPARAARSAPGRHLTRVVEGVRFSLRLHGCCWARGPVARVPALGSFRDRGLFVSKDTTGPQGAEAVFFWTSFPDATNTDPCANLLRRPIGHSAGDLVSAMATRPGIELVDGPVKAAVGGRRATYASLRVFLDLGCDPGYFFTWKPRGPHDSGCWGPCWLESSEGDTIEVWVVEVRGARLVFQAETSADVDPDVHREVRQMVRSIRFLL